MTHILGIDEYVTEKLKIKPITKKMLRDTTSYKNKIDFIKAKGIVNGMDFEKVKTSQTTTTAFISARKTAAITKSWIWALGVFS